MTDPHYQSLDCEESCQGLDVELSLAPASVDWTVIREKSYFDTSNSKADHVIWCVLVHTSRTFLYITLVGF